MHTWGNEELRFATASDSNDAAGMVCIQVTRFRFEGQCSIAILVGYYLSYMNLSQMADITLIALQTNQRWQVQVFEGIGQLSESN